MTNEYEEMNKRIINTLELFDYNVSKTDELLKKGFPEVSIMLIVSAFESFLGDIFESCSDNWFEYCNVIERKKNTYNYLKKNNKLDEFIRKRYYHSDCVYENSELNYNTEKETLLDILLGNDSKNAKGKINFQNLKDDYGAKNAYKTFFNIDLSATGT